MTSPYAVGSYLHCWWEDDHTYETRSGRGVIVATSRAARKLTLAQAEQLLREWWDADEQQSDVVGAFVTRWHAITRRDWPDLSPEQDRSGFGDRGSGQGWIEVALPKFDQGA